MPDIKSVWIQTAYAHADRGDPGAVEIGYYYISGRDLIMCDENGKPMARPHRLGPDDDPQVIAGRLTRERWLKTDGGTNFNRRIVMPRWGVA